MHTRMISLLFLGSTLIATTGCENKPPQEQESNQNQESSQVKQRLDGYVKSLNARDADQVVVFWSDEAVYRNPVTGNLVEGKKGIKKEMLDLFQKMNDTTFEVENYELRFPTDNKAVIEGITKVSRPGKEVVESQIKIIFVKENGEWNVLHVSRLDLGALK